MRLQLIDFCPQKLPYYNSTMAITIRDRDRLKQAVLVASSWLLTDIMCNFVLKELLMTNVRCAATIERPVWLMAAYSLLLTIFLLRLFRALLYDVLTD